MKDTALPTASPLSPTLQDIVRQFRLLGWSGFWLELGLTFIAVISLLFAWSGRSFSEQTL